MSDVATPPPRESGRGLPSDRLRDGRRRARESRVKFWRIVIVSAFFIVVLGANLFVGVVVLVKNERELLSESTKPKMGRVSFPMYDGVFCRHVVFDNKTGHTVEDKVSRCDNRDTLSTRDSASPSTFNWGRH